VPSAALDAAIAEERPEKRQRLVKEAAEAAKARLEREAQAELEAAQDSLKEAQATVREKRAEAGRVQERLRDAEVMREYASKIHRDQTEAEDHVRREGEAMALEASQQQLSSAEAAALRAEVEEEAHAAQMDGADAAAMAAIQARLEAAARTEADEHQRAAAAAARAEGARRAIEAAEEATRRAAREAEEAKAREDEERVRRETVTAAADLAAAAVVAHTEDVNEATAKVAVVAEAVSQIAPTLVSMVQTSRGVRDEPAGIAALPGFVQGNKECRYRNFSIGAKQFRFGGIIDGRHAETGQMLEVKNRQNRLFDCVPLYEKIQVMVYLFLYQESSCILRQCYAGETKEDEVLWNEASFRRFVEPGLLAFAEDLEKMDADAFFRLQVLSANPAKER